MYAGSIFCTNTSLACVMEKQETHKRPSRNPPVFLACLQTEIAHASFQHYAFYRRTPGRKLGLWTLVSLATSAQQTRAYFYCIPAILQARKYTLALT